MATLLALLSSGPAYASEECVQLCAALDAVEEACEAAHGERGFCATIGLVEETCDPEDGGTTDTCEGLCGQVDALDDACDATYGESDGVCQGLDALAEDCEDGSYDGEGGDHEEDDEEDDEDEDDGTAEPTRATPSTLGAGCSMSPGAGALVLAFAGHFALRRR